MTAPVTAEKVGEEKNYLVSFTVPAKYTMDSLPEPVNKVITIHQFEPHKAAAVQFSGYLNEKSTLKKIQELEDWLKKSNLKTKSGFIAAQYNPPWTLGPFRKNEIIAEVA